MKRRHIKIYSKEDYKIRIRNWSSEFQCLFTVFFIFMENTISNIYSVDIYGQLHLEPSTAACSFLQNFDLGGGKNYHFRNSIKSLLFHFHYIRFNND